MSTLKHYESASSLGKGKSLIKRAFSSESPGEASTIGRNSSSVENRKSLQLKSTSSFAQSNNGKISFRVEKTRSFTTEIPADELSSTTKDAKSSPVRFVQSGNNSTPSTVTTGGGTTPQSTDNMPILSSTGGSGKFPRRASSNVEKTHFSPSTLRAGSTTGTATTTNSPTRLVSRPSFTKGSSPMIRHVVSTTSVLPSPSRPLSNRTQTTTRRLASFRSSESLSNSESPSKPNRIILIARDRGSPIKPNLNDASHISPIAPADEASFSSMPSQVDVLNTTSASPIDAFSHHKSFITSNQHPSPIFGAHGTKQPETSTTPDAALDRSQAIIDAAKSSERRRRKQILSKRASSSMLSNIDESIVGPQSVIKLGSQDAFDVPLPPSKSSVQELRKRPSREDVLAKSVNLRESPDEDGESRMRVVESPGDVGKRVSSPPSSNKESQNTPSSNPNPAAGAGGRKLGRSYRSAPTNLVLPGDDAGGHALPPKPKLSRYKPDRSQLAEDFIGDQQSDRQSAAPPSIAQLPSPSEMRDLFKKTLDNAERTKVRMFNKRPSQMEKRKTKQENIIKSLDSPRDIRMLCVEDGGLLKSDFRKIAWPVLLADANRRIPKDELQEMAPAEGANAPLSPDRKQDHRQIDLDVERKYDEGDLESRNRLRKFLHSFFYAHPELCYFQGFHDLCSVVLRIFDDDLVAEFVLFKLSTNTIVKDAHRLTMDAVFPELKSVFYILECADPELAERLRTTVGEDSFWGISMLTCLFAHDVVDLTSIERILDACVACGPHFPLYLVASLAVLQKTRQYLMTCECDETTILGTLRQDARDIQALDADELVRFALILERRVPPSKVVENAYRRFNLPTDSFLSSRWLFKSKWMFGSTLKVRERALGE